MDPVAIERPVQLLVEGKDPRDFFGALSGHLGLAGVQVQNYGGINELGGFLKAFVMGIAEVGAAIDACIQDFFACVEGLGIPISRPEKSRARAYLATTPDPQVSVGVAARLRHWNFDHEAFLGVRRFLRDLAADRPAE